MQNDCLNLKEEGRMNTATRSQTNPTRQRTIRATNSAKPCHPSAILVTIDAAIIGPRAPRKCQCGEICMASRPWALKTNEDTNALVMAMARTKQVASACYLIQAVISEAIIHYSLRHIAMLPKPAVERLLCGRRMPCIRRPGRIPPQVFSTGA